MYRSCIHRWGRTGLLLISAGTLATCLGAASSLGGAGAASTVLQKKVVLTNASSGTTTVVTKGEDVVVKLSSPGFEWTEASVLSASPVAVLRSCRATCRRTAPRSPSLKSWATGRPAWRPSGMRPARQAPAAAHASPSLSSGGRTSPLRWWTHRCLRATEGAGRARSTVEVAHLPVVRGYPAELVN